MSRQAIFEASVQYFLEPIGHLLERRIGHRDHGQRATTTSTSSAAASWSTPTFEFASDDALLSAIHNIAQWVGREINEEHPVLDARLPDGSRVHAVIPPSARTGIYLTIRKFTREALTLDDLIGFGSLSEAAKEFLEICVRLRKNMLISGGTGTGKTVLLGAISRAIPEEERIVVIEDTSELRLIQQHTPVPRSPARRPRRPRSARTSASCSSTRCGCGPTGSSSARSAAARRLDLIQSMISGHAGSLSTIHANTPLDALIRLETLSLMSDVQIPVYVARRRWRRPSI